MNYFKKIESKNLKYRVIFEEARIKKLRKKIIDECSLIFYKEKFSTWEPVIDGDLKNRKEIRNCLKGEKVGVYKLDESDLSVKIYHYRYEEYLYPYLVELIDRLLSGDTTSIDEIFNPNLEKENPSFEEIIQAKKEELDKIVECTTDSDTNVKQMRNKLIELNLLMKMLEINKKQKNVIDYYFELQKLITLELIDVISIEKDGSFSTKRNIDVGKRRILKNQNKCLN